MHEANIRANPVPYLERASERIYQLEKTLFEAAQAAKASASHERTEVDKAEYEGLKACLALIEEALLDLRRDQELL